jgi:hypothetical protein
LVGWLVQLLNNNCGTSRKRKGRRSRQRRE